MKKILLALILILTTTFAFGQESKGILYKAINGNKTIYFYGIIDIPYKKVESIDDKIYPLMNEVDFIFIFSKYVDWNEENYQKLNAKYLHSGMYLNGDQLKNHLSSESLQIVKENLLSSQETLENSGINTIKPWLALTILRTIKKQKYPEDEIMDLDYYLLDYILNNSDMESDLELWSTWEETADNIMAIPDDEADRLIAYENDDANIENLYKYWKNGDENQLKKIYEEREIIANSTKNKEMIESNYKFLSRFEEILKEKNKMFIITDVNLLFSKNSILSFFENKGYKIERVN